MSIARDLTRSLGHWFHTVALRQQPSATFAELEAGEVQARQAEASLGQEDLRRLWRLIHGTAAPVALAASDLVTALRSTQESPSLVAEQLVRDVLSDKEYRALQAKGYLDVKSTLYQQRRYRIFRDPRVDRTQVLTKAGRQWSPTEDLCVVPASESIPAGDRFLTHYLLLKSDEKRFCETANHFPVTSGAPNYALPPAPGMERPALARQAEAYGQWPLMVEPPHLAFTTVMPTGYLSTLGAHPLLHALSFSTALSSSWPQRYLGDWGPTTEIPTVPDLTFAGQELTVEAILRAQTALEDSLNRVADYEIGTYSPAPTTEEGGESTL